jgi:hypothetical protein
MFLYKYIPCILNYNPFVIETKAPTRSYEHGYGEGTRHPYGYEKVTEHPYGEKATKHPYGYEKKTEHPYGYEKVTNHPYEHVYAPTGKLTFHVVSNLR